MALSTFNFAATDFSPVETIISESLNSISSSMEYLSNSASIISSLKDGKRRSGGGKQQRTTPMFHGDNLANNNNGFTQQPSLDKSKNTRNRQKQKPSLNSSDLDYSVSVGGGNMTRRNQKVSLNHLLNFSFPERQQHSSSKKQSYQPAFNKERFVNAK